MRGLGWQLVACDWLAVIIMRAVMALAPDRGNERGPSRLMKSTVSLIRQGDDLGVVGEDVDVIFFQASQLARNIDDVLASVPDLVGGLAKSGDVVLRWRLLEVAAGLLGRLIQPPGVAAPPCWAM